MAKEPISAKVSEKTRDSVDRYAEAEGITRSEAIQRLLDQGLDVQRSDVTVIKGTENDVIPDGGKIESIQDTLETTEQELKKTSDQGRYTLPLVGISLIWVGIQLTISIPSAVVVFVGIGLIITLIYAYWKEYVEGRTG